MATIHCMPPLHLCISTHSSEHNILCSTWAKYNIQHNLNQQLHNTMNTERNHPLTPISLLQCWIPYAVTYNLYSGRWAYRCLKHVEIFKIINHNFCIKLVPPVIFIYDAWSHITSKPISLLTSFSKDSDKAMQSSLLKHLHNTNNFAENSMN